MSSSVAFALLAGRVALAVVLLWAACAKLRTLGDFVQSLAHLGPIGPSGAQFLAVVVISLEIVIGLALITGLFLQVAVFSAMLLFAAFVVGICITLVRGIKARCNCFGSVSEESISALTLARALALMGVSALLWVASRTASSQTVAGADDYVSAGSVAAGFVTVILLIPGFEVAVRAFRTQPILFPTRTYRMSFRYAPMDGSANIRRGNRGG